MLNFHSNEQEPEVERAVAVPTGYDGDRAEYGEKSAADAVPCHADFALEPIERVVLDPAHAAADLVIASEAKRSRTFRETLWIVL